MRISMVWKTRAAGLVLLAVASCVARAQGPNENPRDAADPGAYRQLDGVWQCHFLKTNNALEKQYYSNWTFDATKKEVIIMLSPLHKGRQLAYSWDGTLLILDYLFDGKRPNFANYKVGINNRGQLVIHDPNSRWKGWLCDRATSEQWPDDKLQFLDYTRYPWLSSSIEDGPSIMQYREPKQYQEWLKSRPR